MGSRMPVMRWTAIALAREVAARTRPKADIRKFYRLQTLNDQALVGRAHRFTEVLPLLIVGVRHEGTERGAVRSLEEDDTVRLPVPCENFELPTARQILSTMLGYQRWHRPRFGAWARRNFPVLQVGRLEERPFRRAATHQNAEDFGLHECLVFFIKICAMLPSSS